LTFTLPPTDGNNTNVLQTDGNGILTWVAAAGGGATVPGGADTQVQYNNGGAFGGDATFNFNDTTKILDVDGQTITGTTAIGLDMSGGTFATAVQNWPANPVIRIAGSNYFRSNQTNFNGFLGFDSFSGVPGAITQAQNDGEQNIGVGYETGYNNDRSGGGNEGRRNVYIGYQAGKGDAAGNTGFENVAIGSFTLTDLTSGRQNVAIGYAAGASITTGQTNFCLGNGAGNAITTGTSNMFIGSEAGKVANGVESVGIGRGSLILETGAGGNTCIGAWSGSNVTGGTFNLYIGDRSGRYNQTGVANVGIGSKSAGGDAGGVGSANFNTCVGEGAGKKLKGGASNTLLGQAAGEALVTGASNVIIGRFTGVDVTESNNVILGHQAGVTATAINRCIYIGNYAGYRQTTLDDILIIDNRQQSSTADEVTNAIVYGVMHATPASQSLRFNVGTTTWHNATHSDADGGRANQLNFKGQQSGGEETTLARIEMSHDGAADDQKGQIQLYTNAGSDGDAPTLQVTIAADGGVHVANLKSGTDQADAGAAAGELYQDTNDDNTIKMGV
jgi:hypothetical protein